MEKQRKSPTVTLSLDERLIDSQRRATSMSLPAAVLRRLDLLAELAKAANASRAEIIGMLIAEAGLDKQLAHRILAYREKTVGEVIPEQQEPSNPGSGDEKVVTFPMRPPGRPSHGSAG